MTKRTPGFTLIALLIVVAIIALLAAIAVPNFLEAQTRARISAVKADQRTGDRALNSYRVDYNTIPYTDILGVIFRLTTPVAHLSSPLQAAFFDLHDKYYGLGTAYGNSIVELYGMIPFGVYNREWYNDVYKVLNTAPGTSTASGPWIYETNFQVFAQTGEYMMLSQGPHGGNAYEPYSSPPGYGWIWLSYDPTNGTISNGNIIRLDGRGIQN